MPRKSAASLSVANISVQARRVKPPEGLPEPALALWRQLVDALPADRFHSSDRPLLALYCRALSQAAIAYGKLEKYGAADGDAISPWQRVADSAVKQVGTLATRLRLCPQSRMDRKVAGPAARLDYAGPKLWDPPGQKPPWEPEGEDDAS